jgi:sodium-dependent dicarboxylate transporter 2/3/5
MLGLAAIIVGSFMAQLTIFIILVPIVLAIFEELDYEKGDRAPMLIMISLLMFTTYANFTTPIGKVMPIMAMTLYTRFTGGLEISIFNYMLVGIPLTVVVFVVTMLFLKLTFKADFTKLDNIDTEFLKKDIEPMSRKEKISAIVFAAVVFLWLAPGVLEPITFLQPILQVIAKMGAPTPPMIGIIILCIIKDEGEPIVDVEKLLREGVTWSVILIIAATAILGDALTNTEAGIPEWIGGHLAPVLSQLPPIICVLLILTVAIILTNFVSDMVTVMLLASISLPMIISGAVPGINAAALAYLIGQASTIGPATAVGGASSAIASGNGYLSPSKMFSWGMVLSLLCALLLTFIGYPLANALM